MRKSVDGGMLSLSKCESKMPGGSQPLYTTRIREYDVSIQIQSFHTSNIPSVRTHGSELDPEVARRSKYAGSMLSQKS